LDQAIAWLATATGFTPVEAVRWATMAPADSVGWSELGRFVPGVAADLDQLRPTAGPAAATFIAGWLA
jgi:imidazolonepropionase-like amidohydrolase